MKNQFFAELSRRLREEQIESNVVGEDRLEVSLRGQPVLFVSPNSDVFLLPAGSGSEEAGDLYHKVAMTADEVYAYVEAVQNAPVLRAADLHEPFHLLADFGGAVLAGRELEQGRGYQFVTWDWDFDRLGVSHGHYYLAALETLERAKWKTDYVITHCAPTHVALAMDRRNEPDALSDFLEMVDRRLAYTGWFFGHFHGNRVVTEKHILLWEQIIQMP